MPEYRDEQLAPYRMLGLPVLGMMTVIGLSAMVAVAVLKFYFHLG